MRNNFIFGSAELTKKGNSELLSMGGGENTLKRYGEN